MGSKVIGKIVRVGLLALIVVVIALQQRKSDSPHSSSEIVSPIGISKLYSLGDVQRIFSSAATLKLGEQDSTIAFVYNAERELLGQVICSSPYADSIIGYAGPTPVLIGIASCDTIVGVTLLANDESPGYIRKIQKKDFFTRWNGMSVKAALNADVDVVSGATYSTDAIIQNVRVRLSKYATVQPEALPFDWASFSKLIASFCVLAVALVSFFFTAKMKRFRIPLLVSSILVLGFWGGTFMSAALLYGWLVNGIPWMAKVLLVFIFLLAFVLPLFTNKSFYCTIVCPYGACQELAGKIYSKKVTLPSKMMRLLKWVRPIGLGVIAAILLFGVSVDLTDVEPFSAFTYQTASAVVLVMAIFFLLVSVVIPKPWCNYFCPTGQLLELMRKPGRPIKELFQRRK